MNIQSHAQVSPRSPARARSSGKAGSAKPMESGLLDRFCQPLTLAELESVRRQARALDRLHGQVSRLTACLDDLELSVEFLSLYRAQHLPHAGAQPTELEAASLTAQTRLVTDSLSDLIRAFEAEGLHPAGLMLTLQQLRRAGTSGDGVPADDHSLPGTVF